MKFSDEINAPMALFLASNAKTPALPSIHTQYTLEKRYFFYQHAISLSPYHNEIPMRLHLLATSSSCFKWHALLKQNTTVSGNFLTDIIVI